MMCTNYGFNHLHSTETHQHISESRSFMWFKRRLKRAVLTRLAGSQGLEEAVWSRSHGDQSCHVSYVFSSHLIVVSPVGSSLPGNRIDPSPLSSSVFFRVMNLSLVSDGGSVFCSFKPTSLLYLR